MSMASEPTKYVVSQPVLNQRARRTVDWKKMESVAYPLVFGAALLTMWSTGILNTILGADDFTLPGPGRIAVVFARNIGTILENLQATVAAALGGLVLGSLLGFVVAMIASGFPRWGTGGVTVISAFNAVPIIAIAPIMTNLTKDFSSDPSTRSMIAKMLVVMITCTVAMSVNAYRGLTELKPFGRDLMRSFAASRRQIFFKLRLPNSIPYVFTALRISVPASIISAMVSEYFAEYVIGVGRQIRESIVLAQYTTAWAYIFAALFLGLSMYGVLMIVERTLLRWKP